jgi:hypothetical protein
MSPHRFDEPTEPEFTPASGTAASLPVSGDIDVTAPNIARVYDWLFGGKDNYGADREHGEQLLERLPRTREFAVANRQFMKRVVQFLVAEAGITQFLDFGSGLPTRDNVHEVAQAVNSEARVVYLDNDPVVLSHGRALMASSTNTRVIEADMRKPESQVLRHPDVVRLLDFSPRGRAVRQRAALPCRGG